MFTIFIGYILSADYFREDTIDKINNFLSFSINTDKAL